MQESFVFLRTSFLSASLLLAGCAGSDAAPEKINAPVNKIAITAKGPSQAAYIGIAGSPQGVADMKAGAARVGFSLAHWPQGEAGKLGAYPFARQDADALALKKSGVEPVAFFSYCPEWANAHTRAEFGYPVHSGAELYKDHWAPFDDIAVWKSMIAQIMRRNKGVVTRYAIWNEPDSDFFLPPKALSPKKQDRDVELTKRIIREKYVPMCQAAQEAAREIDPNIQILTIGSHREFFSGEGWTEWCFEAGIAKYTDGLVIHTYPYPYQGGGTFEAQWIEYLNRLLPLMKKHKLDVPVWVTEYGFAKTSSGGRFPLDTGEEPAALWTWHLSMLSTRFGNKPLVQGMTRFRFDTDSIPGENWGVFDTAKNEALPGYDAHVLLQQLFKNNRGYDVVEASVSPAGEKYAPPTLQAIPDNKVKAIRIRGAGAQEFVLAGVWRDRFNPWDWQNGQGPPPVSIPVVENATLTVSGNFTGWKAYSINPDTSEIKPLKIELSTRNAVWKNLTLVPPTTRDKVARPHLLLLAKNTFVAPKRLGKPVVNTTVETQIANKNIFDNGGFESGTLGAWQDYGTNSQVVKAHARTGESALRIGPRGGVHRIVSGLKPSTQYVFRVYARVEGGEQGRITVENFGGETQSAQVLGDEYKAYEVNFKTGANATSAGVFIWKDAGNAFAFADDVELLEKR